MDDPIAAFGAYQRRKNLAPTTIKSRRYRLYALARWLDKPILEATAEDIEKWLGSRELASQTIQSYVSYFAAFWDFAMRARLVDEDPTEFLVRPKVAVVMRVPWDPVEIAYAVDQADARMRCLLLLPMFAGARCVEMSRLRAEDVNRARGKLLLHGKGAKDRTVPLHDLMYEALIRYGLPSEGPVFVRDRRDGGPLAPGTISKYISKHLHDLGFDTTAHRGRSAYATKMYQLSNGDLRMVADLLGHSDLSHLSRYVAWSPSKADRISAQMALPSV